MKNSENQFDWNVFPENVEEVLGEQFWGDLQRMIPKRGPAVDIYQTETEGIVIVELPGIRSIQDVQVKQSGNGLMIQGNIPYNYPIPKEQLIKSERFVGTFSKTISLPFSFGSDGIKGKYTNGLLEIRVPKLTAQRTIDIEFGE